MDEDFDLATVGKTDGEGVVGIAEASPCGGAAVHQCLLAQFADGSSTQPSETLPTAWPSVSTARAVRGGRGVLSPTWTMGQGRTGGRRDTGRGVCPRCPAWAGLRVR